MKWTIDFLRKSGLIAYEYRRGSHMYHLNTPTSDIDTGGVFICPPDMLMGLRSHYVEQVSDEKNDTVFYEFGRWIELLCKSNPTALESLFAPEDCIIGPVHPAVQYILDHRDMFLSRECFKTFYGYAVSQISKARGLNKKIVNPVTERLQVLDFCYTLSEDGTGGSMPIRNWLKKYNLDQKYCGLVNIPNWRDTYGLFYDWAAYFHFENIDWYELITVPGEAPMIKVKYPYSMLIGNAEGRPNGDEARRIHDRIQNKKFFGYTGIVKPFSVTVHNPDGTEKVLSWENIDESTPGIWKESNEVRLCSIPKGEKMLCPMHYNKDAYTCHCRDYNNYKEWEKNRNEVRYEGNLGHNYDAKNVMHCMRLVRMAKELAQGKGFNVVRTYDRDYLLDIRNHKFEYEEVMEQLDKEKAEMEEAILTCTLPDTVDMEAVNKILVESREKYVFNE